MQQNDWRYCAVQRDPRNGQLFMLVHNGQAWTFGYVIKEIIDLTPEEEVVVS